MSSLIEWRYQRGQQSLLDLLKQLSRIQPPVAGSEVEAVLHEAQSMGDISKKAEKEAKVFSHAIQLYLEGKPFKEVRDHLAEYQALRQSYETSQISIQAYVYQLNQLLLKYNPPFEPSGALREWILHQERLEAIQGVRFFEELQLYIQSVIESLIRNEDERGLNEQSGRLNRLTELTRLEITKEDWNQLANELTDEESQLWNRHIAFYRNTGKRDRIFFKKITSLIKSTQDGRAAVVVGGFHTQGLIQQLEASGMGYALIAPQMDAIPKETRYREHMHGNVSWKHYLKAKNGKVALYEAFNRGMRDELLEQGDDRGNLIKFWRDQLIRQLAESNRLSEASRYTTYLDEIVKGFQQDHPLLKRVESFINRLRGLEREGTLNSSRIAQLFAPATIASKFVNPSNLVPGSTAATYVGESTVAVELPSKRSEVRSNLGFETAVLGRLRDAGIPVELWKRYVDAYEQGAQTSDSRFYIVDDLLEPVQAMYKPEFSETVLTYKNVQTRLEREHWEQRQQLWKALIVLASGLVLIAMLIVGNLNKENGKTPRQEFRERQEKELKDRVIKIESRVAKVEAQPTPKKPSKEERIAHIRSEMSNGITDGQRAKLYRLLIWNLTDEELKKYGITKRHWFGQEFNVLEQMTLDDVLNRISIETNKKIKAHNEGKAKADQFPELDPETFKIAAKEQKIPVLALLSLALQETEDFDFRAQSGPDGRGLIQITPNTLAHRVRHD